MNWESWNSLGLPALFFNIPQVVEMSDEQWEWGKEGVSLCALLELLDNCGFLAVILSFPQREKCIENISLQKMVNNKVAAFVDRTGLFKAEIMNACC